MQRFFRPIAGIMAITLLFFACLCNAKTLITSPAARHSLSMDFPKKPSKRRKSNKANKKWKNDWRRFKDYHASPQAFDEQQFVDLFSLAPWKIFPLSWYEYWHQEYADHDFWQHNGHPKHWRNNYVTMLQSHAGSHWPEVIERINKKLDELELKVDALPKGSSMALTQSIRELNWYLADIQKTRALASEKNESTTHPTF